jgi:hypothetical protein
MKTFFTKYSVWIWVVLFLLILNISALTTILYRNIRQSRVVTHPQSIMHFQRPLPGVYLKDELGLSDEQFTKFIETRNNYQFNAMELNRHINTLKRKYLQELMQNEPDKALIHATIDSVGTMHARLMQETGKYYYQIRQICRDNQVEKLDTFFLRVMQDDGNAGLQGRGMHRGMRNTGRNIWHGRF